MIIKAQQLHTDISNCFGVPENAELQIIKTCVETAMSKARANVDNICGILARLGYSLWGALENWITFHDYSVFKFNGAMEVIRPSCPDLGDLISIPTTDLRYSIGNITHPHITAYTLKTDDRVYRLVPDNMVQAINDACPAHRAVYIPEENDCDDFDRIQLGWLSENGYGNLSWGSLRCEIEYKGGLPGAVHRLCCCLTENKKLMVIEPQLSGSEAIYHYTGPESVTFVNMKKLTPIKIRM